MKIIELVRKDEHDAVVAELQKHLKDANRGAEVNSHINQSLAGQVNKLRADNAELLQRLEERTQSHLAASARDVQTIQRQSVLLDRLATALDDCKKRAMDKSIETHPDDHAKGCIDDIWEWTEAALAAYESAKSGNLPDPLSEAVKRMEEVPEDDLCSKLTSSTKFGDFANQVRTRLIQAAKGGQP